MARKRQTKVAKAESALRAFARKKHITGRKAENLIFGTLNTIGLKKGSKTTPRGRSPAHRTKGRKR